MHVQHTPEPQTRPRRLAVVGRVSTREQEAHGTSLDDQDRKGNLLAQLHSMEVVPSKDYQGDESGALPLSARPIMQRLIADAQAGCFDAVCFHKIDRIARRLKYILEVWDALTDAGVTVYVIEPAIDTGTLMGRLLRNVLGTIAEFERDLIEERTSGGRERELRGGAIYAPRGKYGYEYVKRDRARGVVPGVRPHADYADVVRGMFRTRARGLSYERIALELTAAAVPSPSVAAGHKRQSSRWHEGQVRRIIQDSAYMGEGAWGQSSFVRGPSGTRLRRVAKDGRAPIDLAYPPLVTAQEWHAANAAGKSGRVQAVRGCVDNYLLYGGLVRCTEHGNTMSGSAAKQGTHYYRCKRRLYPGGTATHGVPALDLEGAVWAKVTSAVLDETLMLEAAERLASEAEQGMEGDAHRRMQIAARLATLETQVGWIGTTMREAGSTAAEMAAQLKPVREEQGRLEQEMVQLAARLALHQAELPRAQHISATCRQMRERIAGADAATKRALLEDLEVSVQLDGRAFRIEGILGVLGLEGNLPVHTSVSSGRSSGVRGVPFVLCGDLGLTA